MGSDITSVFAVSIPQVVRESSSPATDPLAKAALRALALEVARDVRVCLDRARTNYVISKSQIYLIKTHRNVIGVSYIYYIEKSPKCYRCQLHITSKSHQNVIGVSYMLHRKVTKVL